MVVGTLVLGPGRGRADPVLELPPPGRGTLWHAPEPDRDPGVDGSPSGGGRSVAAAGSTDPARLPGAGGPGELALLAELGAVTAVGRDYTTLFPEVGELTVGQPELARLRVGLVAWSGTAPIAGAMRLDLAEGLRLESADFEEAPVAATSSLIDDLYAAWTPTIWAQLWLGRQPVPFSRFRHGEEALMTSGAVPFTIDRIAPDRRWGAAFHGDLGAIAYASGVYVDGPWTERSAARLDYAEPASDPSFVANPSERGRWAWASHIEWTPRAPMGPDRIASPRSDPWYSTPRVSAGAGALVRGRAGEVGNRVDLSMSGAAKLRAAAALVEVLLALDDGEVSLAAVAEASVTVTDRSLLFARGEYDGEIDVWSSGGGAGWFVTRDRWNRLSIYGFVLRSRPDLGPSGDGIVVQLQTAL